MRRVHRAISLAVYIAEGGSKWEKWQRFLAWLSKYFRYLLNKHLTSKGLLSILDIPVHLLQNWLNIALHAWQPWKGCTFQKAPLFWMCLSLVSEFLWPPWIWDEAPALPCCGSECYKWIDLFPPSLWFTIWVVFRGAAVSFLPWACSSASKPWDFCWKEGAAAAAYRLEKRSSAGRLKRHYRVPSPHLEGDRFPVLRLSTCSGKYVVLWPLGLGE